MRSMVEGPPLARAQAADRPLQRRCVAAASRRRRSRPPCFIALSMCPRSGPGSQMRAEPRSRGDAGAASAPARNLRASAPPREPILHSLMIGVVGENLPSIPLSFGQQKRPSANLPRPSLSSSSRICLRWGNSGIRDPPSSLAQFGRIATLERDSHFSTMTELCHTRVTLSSTKANEINVLQNFGIRQQTQSLVSEKIGFEIQQEADFFASGNIFAAGFGPEFPIQCRSARPLFRSHAKCSEQALREIHSE
jgi:hypothetical protein